MRFQKILLATDFTPSSEPAATLATRRAAQTGAELVIAHAWFLPAAMYPLDQPLPAEVISDLMADARGHLDEAVRKARDAGAQRVQGALLGGPPWAQIVDLLEREAFDLCVMGTHGRTGIKRLILGSVAERVVRHAPCSVLTVPPRGGWTGFSHALVPTDLSTNAEQAADTATDLVPADGQLTLLHVVELFVPVAGELPVTLLHAELESTVGPLLRECATRLATKTKATITLRTRVGNPKLDIIAALEEDPTTDLVVMGSHGRTGIKRALLGSVAEYVVRHARCPVLIARERAAIGSAT